MLVKEIKDYINNEVSEYLKRYKENANLYFHDLVEKYNDYVVAEFYGGINGRGDWEDYLKAIYKLVGLLNVRYNCWLVNLDNDCLDDVFYLKIGIKRK